MVYVADTAGKVCWKVWLKLAFPVVPAGAGLLLPSPQVTVTDLITSPVAVALQVTGARAENRVAEAEIVQLGPWSAILGTVTVCVTAALVRFSPVGDVAVPVTEIVKGFCVVVVG
jgi:hypothetical protein